MMAESVRSALHAWMDRYTESSNVSLVELNVPRHDSSDDYSISYEASFESKDYERAYLNLFVSTMGNVGIGLETRERVARRLGVKNWTKRLAFAVGHEPGPLTLAQLQIFIELVANAKIVLIVKTSLLGLGSIEASVRPEDLAQLRPLTKHWDWLSASSAEFIPSKSTKIVRFLPW
jgi:hypothetical protein